MSSVETKTSLRRGAGLTSSNHKSTHMFHFVPYSIPAIRSYCSAIKLLEDMDKSAQASGLCLEVGDKLRDLGKVSEAVGFYQRSADLRYHTTNEKYFIVGKSGGFDICL